QSGFEKSRRSGSHAEARSIRKHGTQVSRLSYGRLKKKRPRTGDLPQAERWNQASRLRGAFQKPVVEWGRKRLCRKVRLRAKIEYQKEMISEQQNPTRCEPLITADRAAELLKLHPKTVKRLAQAGELPGMKIGR